MRLCVGWIVMRIEYNKYIVIVCCVRMARRGKVSKVLYTTHDSLCSVLE